MTKEEERGGKMKRGGGRGRRRGVPNPKISHPRK
jgi:hypothetical protein